uniref:Uncharacterized protein n=1 Tax=Rhizophora mucronata TaxID=61149 RepID=A0A2P2MY14_RHIMU
MQHNCEAKYISKLLKTENSHQVENSHILHTRISC